MMGDTVTTAYGSWVVTGEIVDTQSNGFVVIKHHMKHGFVKLLADRRNCVVIARVPGSESGEGVGNQREDNGVGEHSE